MNDHLESTMADLPEPSCSNCFWWVDYMNTCSKTRKIKYGDDHCKKWKYVNSCTEKDPK